MAKLKDDPAVMALIEKEVAKATATVRRDAAKLLRDASAELLRDEGFARDFVRAHKAFVADAVARIKASA